MRWFGFGLFGLGLLVAAPSSAQTATDALLLCKTPADHVLTSIDNCSAALKHKDLSETERGEAYAWRAGYLSLNGQQKRALADYDKAIAIFPYDANLYVERARTREWLGQKKRAIRDYKKALELDPNNQFAQSGLYTLGEGPPPVVVAPPAEPLPAAVAPVVNLEFAASPNFTCSFDPALVLPPGCTSTPDGVLFRMTCLLTPLTNAVPFGCAADPPLPIFPQPGEAPVLSEQLLPEAPAIAAPNLPADEQSLIAMCIGQGNVDERVGACTRMMESSTSPELTRVWRANRAKAYSDNQRLAEALPDLEILISETPNDANLLVAYGGVLALQGRYSESRVALDRALSIDPNLEAARNALAALSAMEIVGVTSSDPTISAPLPSEPVAVSEPASLPTYDDYDQPSTLGWLWGWAWRIALFGGFAVFVWKSYGRWRDGDTIGEAIGSTFHALWSVLPFARGERMVPAGAVAGGAAAAISLGNAGGSLSRPVELRLIFRRQTSFQAARN